MTFSKQSYLLYFSIKLVPHLSQVLDHYKRKSGMTFEGKAMSIFC